MHNALSFQRVHQPKGYTTATYHPETNMAYTYNPKGTHFSKMGVVKSAKDDPLGADGFRGQRLWLLPEEVLYLLERGSLDVRWPEFQSEEESAGLPMSLQGAYAMFIGDDSQVGGLTFERYSVYAGLKRIGYTVLRAPTWDAPGPPPSSDCFAPFPQRTWQAGLLNSITFWRTVFAKEPKDDTEQQVKGPLVSPQLFRSYDEIYRRLSLVNFHDPTVQFFQPYLEPPEEDPEEMDLSFRITYHVWKPGSQTFKKSDPGTPDFRIAVVNARETTIPTLQQLSSLMKMVPYDPPMPTGQLYQKLRHGYKNVVLAVVDQGVVSYLRMADAAFGREKLHGRKGKGPGGKRGGRAGRGRGR